MGAVHAYHASTANILVRFHYLLLNASADVAGREFGTKRMRVSLSLEKRHATVYFSELVPGNMLPVDELGNHLRGPEASSG
jgi:hypothetical protein